ncbi:hypothetical protein TNCV_2455251 [Trichonephila clavipes]|nr:hypothetical protein TNCV_2455251 [Trichonephila clavipes]
MSLYYAKLIYAKIVIFTSKRRPLCYNSDSMETWRNIGDRAKLASFLATKLCQKLLTEKQPLRDLSDADPWSFDKISSPLLNPYGSVDTVVTMIYDDINH